ncbi:MFS transporter [Microbacterium murale]|uniref:MFS transporter n=1 Tax=Microbacterium murale TaxID=1081040 RepID=UPI0027D7D4AD|nr:MFS transporter [Microbacterium murale]
MWTQLGVLMLVQFVGMMSGTIIATALPAITKEIDGTTLHYTWMFVTTALAAAVTTPLWGRLGDIFDAKTVLQWSLGFYTVGALLCGLAPSADLLIAARVIQGIGIGGHIALTQALAARLVVPRLRAQVNGVMAVSQIGATVSGPLVGALLVGVPGIGWRLCFLLGVPVAIIAAIIVHAVLPNAVAPSEGRVDLLGAVLLVLGLTGLLGWISFVGKGLPFLSSASLLWLGVSVIVLAVAGWWEWRAKDAIVPLRALAGRVPALAAVASLSVGASMFGGTIFVTQYLQLGRGLDALIAGVLLMPMALATFVAALLVGRLSTRSGLIRRYLLAGVILVLLGNAALVPLTPSTPLWWVVVASSLVGAGLGMTVTNLILIAQNATSVRDVGAVSGTIIFCRTLGSTVGLALFGAIVAGYVPAVDSVATSALSELYSQGASLVFLVATGISSIGLVAVALLPPIALRSTVDLAEASTVAA